MQTALNLKTFNEGRKVGQKIHAICLEGPPGAGKSFYATTYTKLAEKLFDEDIEFISYQCNAATGKADLYEEINVSAAIAGDPDKVIISGKLVEAIEKVNNGKKVILFIDEYDKSRAEVDSFFYNFLQDGEIDTNQKGKVKVKDEYLKNLQVIIVKNDERELSQPLSRRFKQIQLDYMKPDILAKTMNRVLKNNNSTIRDAIILLYASLYKTLDNNSEFQFSRLPACSECMKAVVDAEDLMEIGANQTDIVVTGILANLIKNKDDEELFKVFLQQNKNTEFIQWYDMIMEATGRNSIEDLDNLKRALAESFYPEQLRELTREIENTKRDLEYQKQLLEEQTSEYDARKTEIKEAQQVLDSKKKELDKRKRDTEALRKNAYEDAKKGAEQFLQMERRRLEDAYKDLADKLNNDRAQMEEDYQNKYQKLEQEEANTAKLRADAEADALTVANKTIQAEREKMKQEAKNIEDIINAQFEEKSSMVNARIDEVNATIQEFNYQRAQQVSLQDELEYKNAEIETYRAKLTELLGRELNDGDFEEQINEESQEMQNGKEIVGRGFQDFINGEIQENIFEQTNQSIIKYFSKNVFSIGTLVLETKSNKDDFVFKDTNNEILLKGVRTKAIKNEEICKDGVVLYKDEKIVIVGIRVIEHTQSGEWKSVYKFCSNSLVIPIHSLGLINTFIFNINPNLCKANLKYTTPIDMKIDCLVASNREHNNAEGCKFETIEDTCLYRLQYKNPSYTKMHEMAQRMHNLFNCSRINMSEEERKNIEKMAFIKHCQYVLDADVMQQIEHFNMDNAELEIE